MAAEQTRQDVVRRIKEAADIGEIIGEHVSLQRAGANLKGLCPFHAEKTPSFMVSPERGSFHCFGCGEGGDVFSFLMLYHRFSFPEALKQLAGRYRIPLAENTLTPQQKEESRQRENIYALNARAAQLYHQYLLKHAAAGPARDYLAGRGMSASLIEQFQLGYAPDSWDFLCTQLQREGWSPELATEAGLLVAKKTGGEGAGNQRRGHYDRFRDRIIFPIIDLTGRVSGFGGRILGAGEPKYLNTPETPVFDKSRTLFGLYQHRDAIRKARSCLLVEGNFDLLALAAHEINEVAAPLGTALTTEQLQILRGYVDEAVLLFDGDTAGLKAAMRAIPLFLAAGLTGRVAILPTNHDPDTFVRQHGQEGLRQLVAGAAPLPEFVFGELVARHGLGVDGKNRIIAELAPIVHSLDDQLLLRTRFIAHFSDRLGISGDQFCQSIARPPQRRRPAAVPDQHEESLQLEPNEEKILAFLFLHGSYVQDFLAAGLEHITTSPAARSLLALIKVPDPDLRRAPENLLSRAEERFKPLVARLLINGGTFYPDEQREECAEQLMAWLRQHEHKKTADLLNREINAAYQGGDQQRLLKLMQQKQSLQGSRAPAPRGAGGATR